MRQRTTILFTVVALMVAMIGGDAWAGLRVRVTYAPMYYSGRVVFYTNVGTPFYYIGSRRHYVPRSSVHYNRYVSHHRTHRTQYRHWNARHGHRYRRLHHRDRDYRGRRYNRRQDKHRKDRRQNKHHKQRHHDKHRRS